MKFGRKVPTMRETLESLRPQRECLQSEQVSASVLATLEERADFRITDLHVYTRPRWEAIWKSWREITGATGDGPISAGEMKQTLDALAVLGRLLGLQIGGTLPTPPFEIWTRDASQRPDLFELMPHEPDAVNSGVLMGMSPPPRRWCVRPEIGARLNPDGTLSK